MGNLRDHACRILTLIKDTYALSVNVTPYTDECRSAWTPPFYSVL